MSDISQFDTAKEIQKLRGMWLVACSSDKHKGRPESATGAQEAEVLAITGGEVGSCVWKNFGSSMSIIRPGQTIP